MWNPDILDTLLREAAGGTYRPVTPGQMRRIIPGPKMSWRDEDDAPTRLVGNYTGDSYRDYNTLLRRGTLPPDWDARTYMARSKASATAMAKGGIQQLLKAVYASRVTENFVLYRAAVDKEIGAVVKGQSVTVKTFLSGTISLEEALTFYADQRGRFTSGRIWRLLVPAGAAARWAAPASFHEREQEVLLPPGTILTVLSVDQIVTPTNGYDEVYDDPKDLTWMSPEDQAAMLSRAKMGPDEWRILRRHLPPQDWENAVDTLVTATVMTPKTPPTPDTLFGKTTPTAKKPSR